MFPATLGILPQNNFNGLTTSIDNDCGNLSVMHNTRYFQIRVCTSNHSILSDENIGEYDFTDGLQINELQTVYTWDISETPEDPFLLYTFPILVTITRIVITFILSQDGGAKKDPKITMFVSNSNPTYPDQPIRVNYNAGDAPATGVYQIDMVPTVSKPFRYWCIDLEAPAGTDWIIVSEVELYQELQTGNGKSYT